MRQKLWAAVLLSIFASVGGCQTTTHSSTTSQAVSPAATPFIGYWSSGETFGKALASANPFHLDITSDGRAILIASPQLSGGAGLYAGAGDEKKTPDEIRILHWEAFGAGIRLTDPQSPERTFDARMEGDSTLVIASPEFYVRMQR